MTCCVAAHTDPHDPATPGACTRALARLTARPQVTVEQRTTPTAAERAACITPAEWRARQKGNQP